MIEAIAPHRAGLGTLVLFAVAAATASPATATIIDSFTAPLPANPTLPATGAKVLFVGSLCDGAACPPGTIVTNPYFDRTPGKFVSKLITEDGELSVEELPAVFRKMVAETYI